MLKSTADKESKVIHYKVPLYNFGAYKVYVISDPKNKKRRKAFEAAWAHYSNFDYTFVDATLGKNLNVNKMLSSGELSDTFFDPNGCLSKNIIATSISHRSVYEKIVEDNDQTSEGRYYLILEDDARPTLDLVEDIYSGDFKKTIDKVKKQMIDIVWFGRQKRKIAGNYICEHLQENDTERDYGAHAYLINSTLAEELYDNHQIINYAADVYIDEYTRVEKKVIRSTYRSYIQQQGILINKFFAEEGDIDKLWSTSTQVNPNVDELYPEPYHNIKKDIYKWVDTVIELDEGGFIIKLHKT